VERVGLGDSISGYQIAEEGQEGDDAPRDTKVEDLADRRVGVQVEECVPRAP
jgi:hypothetical protein